MVRSQDDEALGQLSSGWVQRRERVMADLEHAALELFAEKGYDEVSYDDIAARAGVSGRTIYRYFPTKEGFLLAAPRRALVLSTSAVAQTSRSTHPVDDYFDAIVALTEAHAAALGEVLLWSRVMRRVPTEVASLVRGESAAALEEVVIGLCSDGLGVPPDDIRAIATAAAIAAVNQAVVEHWTDGDGSEDLRVLFSDAVDGLRRSMRSHRKPALFVEP